MKMLLCVLLLLPQLAAARVYMCVDEATGKTSFTDKACEKTALREEVRVDSTNLDSGSHSGKRSASRTWVSDRDTRKSGEDYSAQRRDVYNSNATAGNQASDG